VIARPALAFCRTAICELGDVGTRCTPATEEDCGVALRWKERCIGFSVQSDGSRFFSAELLAELVTEAFGVWVGVDCDAGQPHFLLKRQADAVCAGPEYNIDFNVNKGNANVVMFHDDVWPYPAFEDGLALTTLTYDAESGEIYDADIEINTFGFTFSTTDTDVGYDLLATLQHETGHFLGIAHSTEADATMQAVPVYGSTERRTLTADDVAAVCDLYPPEARALADSCSPMPHDFSPYCDHALPPEPDRDASAACATSNAPARGAVPLLFAAGMVSAWALRLQRRRGRGRTLGGQLASPFSTRGEDRGSRIRGRLRENRERNGVGRGRRRPRRASCARLRGPRPW
jgi:hypothetical protein